MLKAIPPLIIAILISGHQVEHVALFLLESIWSSHKGLGLAREGLLYISLA